MRPTSNFAFYLCKVKENDNIFQKLARRQMAIRAAKVTRNKAIMNFDTAKTALILMDGADATSEKSILLFFDYLKANKIQADRLSYFHRKAANREAKDSEFLMDKKNISWLGSPKGKEYDPVVNREYDLLFDFSLKRYFALQWIVELSKAKFKIGILKGKTNPYDFMIDPGQSGLVSEYIEQIKKYLPLLK